VSRKSHKDALFFRETWDNSDKQCEECRSLLGNDGAYLGEDFNPSFISHIISKGSDTRMRHDSRNINMMCHYHHAQWEFGDRSKMKINKKNQEIILNLKSEYNGRDKLRDV
jgi:hypothetical protein